ncbi:MAG: DnaJ domain-containing protein [Spiroplasmataceae bacterium]|nr:DnaJ domain-containing protein [Spiroplasmataceae bacterium]
MEYYQILEINKNATPAEIRNAYRRLSLIWHPDRPAPSGFNEQQQTEKFKEISEAYEVLSDPERKKNYDSGGDGFNPNERWDNYFRGQFTWASEERIKLTRAKFGYSGIDPNTYENPPLDPNLWSPYSSWMEKMRDLHDKRDAKAANDFINKLWKAAEKFAEEDRKKWGKEYNGYRENYDFYDINKEVCKVKIGNEIMDKIISFNINDSKLDSSLWLPHKSWAEKLGSLTEEEEIKNFRDKMLFAIEETINKRKRKNQDNSPEKKQPTPQKQHQGSYPKDNQPFWDWKAKFFCLFATIFLIFFLALVVVRRRRIFRKRRKVSKFI